jgi:large subunit ribosomal protein L15
LKGCCKNKNKEDKMVMKTHKRKKSKGQRGTTRYHGARKKWKSSGSKGGKGMAGTGKRADHKKSLIIKLYGSDYFGKQGVTSRGTKKDRRKAMNLRDIETNFDSLLKKYGKGNELDLSEFKILGEGEITKKITIKALAFSESAKEKIKKAGGNTIEVENIENPKKTEERKISNERVQEIHTKNLAKSKGKAGKKVIKK